MSILNNAFTNTRKACMVNIKRPLKHQMKGTRQKGDWYNYSQFFAHENNKIAHKNAQKSFINLG